MHAGQEALRSAVIASEARHARLRSLLFDIGAMVDLVAKHRVPASEIVPRLPSEPSHVAGLEGPPLPVLCAYVEPVELQRADVRPVRSLVVDITHGDPRADAILGMPGIDSLALQNAHQAAGRC